MGLENFIKLLEDVRDGHQGRLSEQAGEMLETIRELGNFSWHCLFNLLRDME